MRYGIGIGTNIWGGIEAELSKRMSLKLDKPVVHAPEENKELFKLFDNIVVDPRKAAEMVTICFLHCCLKGGHIAPKISLKDNAYWNTDIDFLVSPINVFGRPHQACLGAGIPIIVVEENKTVLNDGIPKNAIVVESYVEAAGIIATKKTGVTIDSVRVNSIKRGIIYLTPYQKGGIIYKKGVQYERCYYQYL